MLDSLPNKFTKKEDIKKLDAYLENLEKYKKE